MINKNINLSKKDERGKIVIAILLLITIIGVGYAALGANLKINGITSITSTSWNVRFKANSINVTEGSVEVDTTNNEQAATITNVTQVNYAVKLAKPGDFYEFTVIAENAGSIDAMIDSVVSKRGDTVITTGTLPSYIDYSVTYADGVTISPKQILAASTEETFKVKIAYRTDIEATDLPTEAVSLDLNFQINYVQADDNATEVPHPRSLEDDSWETIISKIKKGQSSVYSVGSTKPVTLNIDLDNDGTPEDHTYTLRVANNSTPEECSTQGFSQTACGFVLEFTDIITLYKMNDNANNIGGWPSSIMRTYINSDIFNALPVLFRNSIIDTNVRSSHGSLSGESVFTSVDKLYLLSSKEVGFDLYYDNSKAQTRILDFYTENNTNSNRIKKYNDNSNYWWLRSAYSTSNRPFISVNSSGNTNEGSDADHEYGVSPAFRIG